MLSRVIDELLAKGFRNIRLERKAYGFPNPFLIEFEVYASGRYGETFLGIYNLEGFIELPF